MRKVHLLCQGKPILINLDQIVAIGSCQYDSNKTWINLVNGEEFTIDSPYNEVLKCIPSEE